MDDVVAVVPFPDVVVRMIAALLRFMACEFANEEASVTKNELAIRFCSYCAKKTLWELIGNLVIICQDCRKDIASITK